MTPIIRKMLCVPFGLTKFGITQIDGENVSEFDLKEAMAFWSYVADIAEGQMETLSVLLGDSDETQC